MARSLINAFIDAIAAADRTDLLLSDFVDYETSRGKLALVEAIRGKHHEMIDLLLSFNADTRNRSKLHRKSAIDWAKMTCQSDVVEKIADYHKIHDHLSELFSAITKHDIEAVRRLTEASCAMTLCALSSLVLNHLY